MITWPADDTRWHGQRLFGWEPVEKRWRRTGFHCEIRLQRAIRSKAGHNRKTLTGQW